MMKPLVLGSVISSAIGAVSVRLQQAARHNAMVAATTLTERRQERDDVEAYLRRTLRRRVGDSAADAG